MPATTTTTMTPIQQKRLRELQTKLKEKLKMHHAEELAAGPPADRVSIFGSTHYGTGPSAWVHAIGIGWYVKSEQPYFDRKYVMCCETERYILRTDAVEVYNRSTYVSRKELSKGKWGLCKYTKKAALVTELVPARASDGTSIMVAAQLTRNNDYFSRCDYTKELFPSESLFEISRPLNYATVSRFAIESNPSVFSKCRHCGHWKETADIVARPDLDGAPVICTSCYEALIASSLIRDYNYTGYPAAIATPGQHQVRRVKGNKTIAVDDDYFRMFGVECEVEIDKSAKAKGLTRYSLAKEIYSALGKDFVVIKRDGSLDMNIHDESLIGFEVVTAPADLSAHRERWKAFETMPNFSLLRAWDTITCGMHVHVSRNVLTTLQIGRIIVFVNHPDNKKFIATVAGRSCGPNGYNRICDKKLGDGVRQDPDKYVAVNTKHQHTIEFRIFRGTVRYRHIIRNIEFVDAVCAFCHPASRSLADMGSYKKFLEFMSANRKTYPLLAEWLAAKGFIKAARPKPGTTPEPVVEVELVETGEKSAR